MTGSRAPTDIFRLLADDTRVDILRAVAVAQYDLDQVGSGAAELAFSEIYDRVDVENTSKLSYHLGELTGIYLRKTDDGYSLSHAGERIVRFILAENYGSPESFGPEPVDGVCIFCGADALEASLVHQFFRIDCTACERQVSGQPITPAQVKTRESDALVQSVKRRSAEDARLVRQRLCPECGAQLSVEVVGVPASALPEADSFVVMSTCEECLREYNTPLTYSAVYHPASIAFHWEHGVDVTARGLWEFHEYVYEGRWTSEQVASDPDEYEVVLRHGEDAVRLYLDLTATVVRTERVRRESG
ncbi:winged helix-turn-helix domain-containing protein [Halobellus limi]|jgi:DNA-binding transcriptional ArsR family regulator|uniref:ArsR family transcriptional regulator n=1 Tax=Halobellus limi TaxID=699433 RepID=A0A1H6BT24_9EURY|nr:helix-turn-helix domain-containing protein [Halobellus limi]QCC49493.1 ArsR family transcriptional regulator [Halobellus limi]SEG63881.1 Helix-turn-helix domain-containing protein [Halobellus limi]